MDKQAARKELKIVASRIKKLEQAIAESVARGESATVHKQWLAEYKATEAKLRQI